MITSYLRLALVLVAIAATLLLGNNAQASSKYPRGSVHKTSTQTIIAATKNPGSVVAVASGGIALWTGPSNAKTSNNAYASSSLETIETTYQLKATGFGFSIPSTATVTGIQVDIESREGLPGTQIQESVVKLVVGGSVRGLNRAGCYLTTEDTYCQHGWTLDTWGLTLTPSDVNSSNFGAVVSYFAMTDDTVYVDHIRMTVYYED